MKKWMAASHSELEEDDPRKRLAFALEYKDLAMEDSLH